MKNKEVYIIKVKQVHIMKDKEVKGNRSNVGQWDLTNESNKIQGNSSNVTVPEKECFVLRYVFK